jgi:GNAT superfamily N-acetyltransferase
VASVQPIEGTSSPRYPSELERRILTREGTELLVRPIRPDDADRLLEFHRGLSSRSTYLRFFMVHPVLSETEVARFTQVDYNNRLALVVMDADRMVAVGRYDRIPGTSEAEVAFVVDDSYQHHGLGTLLADDLADAARQRGVSVFVAQTLGENGPMLEVFHGLGFPVTCRYDDGIVLVRFPIAPVPSYQRARDAREATRRTPAAQSATPAGS